MIYWTYFPHIHIDSISVGFFSLFSILIPHSKGAKLEVGAEGSAEFQFPPLPEFMKTWNSLLFVAKMDKIN